MEIISFYSSYISQELNDDIQDGPTTTTFQRTWLEPYPKTGILDLYYALHAQQGGFRYPEAMRLLEEKKISTPKKWVKAIKDWVASIRLSETNGKIPFDEKLMVIDKEYASIFDKRGDIQSVSLMNRNSDECI